MKAIRAWPRKVEMGSLLPLMALVVSVRAGDVQEVVQNPKDLVAPFTLLHAAGLLDGGSLCGALADSKGQQFFFVLNFAMNAKNPGELLLGDPTRGEGELVKPTFQGWTEKDFCRILEQAIAERFKSHDGDEDFLAQDMLRQCEKVLQRPNPFFSLAQAEESRRMPASSARLQSMLVDAFLIHDQPAAEALKALAEKSRVADPGGKGVVMRLDQGAAHSAGDVKITLTVRRVTVLQALKYICELAPLEFEVREEEVVVRPKGTATAARLAALRRRAENGDADAQYHLGLGCVQEEEGGARFTPEAVKWFRRAAEQGHADAEYLFGRSYSGWGRSRDPIEELAWVTLAAGSGSFEAKVKRNSLERELGREATLRARQRSEELRKTIDGRKNRPVPR